MRLPDNFFRAITLRSTRGLCAITGKRLPRRVTILRENLLIGSERNSFNSNELRDVSRYKVGRQTDMYPSVESHHETAPTNQEPRKRPPRDTSAGSAEAIPATHNRANQ